MMNVMNYQDYDVILQVFKDLEKMRIEEAQQCFAGNFKSTVLNDEVTRDEYLEAYQHIKEGMPDAKFRIIDLTTNGDCFKACVKITGTHTHTFPSMKRGWRKMKATKKRVNKVISRVEFVLRGEQISEIRNFEPGKGIVAGLLNELHLLPKNYSYN